MGGGAPLCLHPHGHLLAGPPDPDLLSVGYRSRRSDGWPRYRGGPHAGQRGRPGPHRRQRRAHRRSQRQPFRQAQPHQGGPRFAGHGRPHPPHPGRRSLSLRGGIHGPVPDGHPYHPPARRRDKGDAGRHFRRGSPGPQHSGPSWGGGEGRLPRHEVQALRPQRPGTGGGGRSEGCRRAALHPVRPVRGPGTAAIHRRHPGGPALLRGPSLRPSGHPAGPRHPVQPPVQSP